MANRFFDDVAEIFEVSQEDLSAADVFIEKSPWDSLKVLSVISVVDEHFSIALSTNDVLKCRNVQDILSTVRSKGGQV